jgi:hypothetical protein
MGFHEAATIGSSITGSHINMFTPQALRAVIGITIAYYYCPAVLAGKVFHFSTKFLGHTSYTDIIGYNLKTQPKLVRFNSKVYTLSRGVVEDDRVFTRWH